MKKLIYTIAFTLAGLVGMAQTNQPLPSGAVPFGATTYLSPLDSTIWLYNERNGTAIKVANWVDVDSLFGLGYTKTQVDALLAGKQNTITGAASTVVSTDLTPNRVVISNSLGKIINTSTVTSTELGYLSGVTSPIQAQIDGKQDTSKLASFTDISASLKGGTIIFFGDSYIAGSGASPSSNRWSTLFSKQFGATENNQGIAGATLMKRAPIDYMGAQNMVDRRTDIPAKTATLKMLVFAFGLNDMGQTAAAYTTANYKADYATVLNHAIGVKGWQPSQILLVSPYYIGQDGYDRYATITGNAAPTRQRHLQFIQATKEVAEQFGTMYWSPFFDQIKNDTTLLDPDGIHPNNAGYEYIFRAATAQFENTDYLPMTGGILRGSLGFQNGYSNVPALIDNSPSASYMNLHVAPVNNGNVGQSLSVSPRGTGVNTEGGSLNIRSQLVLWNQDFISNPSVQEGLVMRAAGNYYEIASVTAISGGEKKPIAISATGQNHNSTPQIYLDTTGTIGIKKKTGLNTAHALDVNGSAVFSGNIASNNVVTLPTFSTTLDFPSTPAGATSVLTVNITGVSAGDIVLLGLPSGLSDGGFYTYKAWASGTDTVKVQFINLSTSAIDPGSATFKIKVFK